MGVWLVSWGSSMEAMMAIGGLAAHTAVFEIPMEGRESDMHGHGGGQKSMFASHGAQPCLEPAKPCSFRKRTASAEHLLVAGKKKW